MRSFVIPLVPTVRRASPMEGSRSAAHARPPDCADDADCSDSGPLLHCKLPTGNWKLAAQSCAECALESSPESTLESKLESSPHRFFHSSSQSSSHRFAHRSSQSSAHRFLHRLLQSSVDSSRLSSLESSAQSSFQGLLNGFFESSFKGLPPGDPYMRILRDPIVLNRPRVIELRPVGESR